jgi:uncharacterized membrane-anchored protein YitT (DUF2179 family)
MSKPAPSRESNSKTLFSNLSEHFFLALGCVIAALAVQMFLIPNRLIDGGTVGLAMILSHIVGAHKLPFLTLVLTIPFVIVAYRYIGKGFVLRMSYALVVFATSNFFLHDWAAHYVGDVLEVVVFGGLCLGTGCGLILRHGGSIDGTEITAILIHRLKGFTVGQVILFCNIFIFALAGVVYHDWTTALRSLMVYMVAYKVIDAVIVGIDEMKSVTIISRKPQEMTDALIHQMGVGVTVMYGRGGYSKEEKEILYVILERLQLVELKQIVQKIDPEAFIAIDNLHEIVTPQQSLD